MEGIHRAKGFEKIVEPIRLTPQSKIQFQCYPGVPCFSFAALNFFYLSHPTIYLDLENF